MPGWQPVSLGTSLESISTLLPPCLTGESHEIMMCTDQQAWRAPEVQLAWRRRCARRGAGAAALWRRDESGDAMPHLLTSAQPSPSPAVRKLQQGPVYLLQDLPPGGSTPWATACRQQVLCCCSKRRKKAAAPRPGRSGRMAERKGPERCSSRALRSVLAWYWSCQAFTSALHCAERSRSGAFI